MGVVEDKAGRKGTRGSARNCRVIAEGCSASLQYSLSHRLEVFRCAAPSGHSSPVAAGNKGGSQRGGTREVGWLFASLCIAIRPLGVLLIPSTGGHRRSSRSSRSTKRRQQQQQHLHPSRPLPCLLFSPRWCRSSDLREATWRTTALCLATAGRGRGAELPRLRPQPAGTTLLPARRSPLPSSPR